MLVLAPDNKGLLGFTFVHGVVCGGAGLHRNHFLKRLSLNELLLFNAGVLFELPTNTQRIEELERRATTKGVAWLPIAAPIVTLLTIMVTVGIHLDNKIGILQKDAATDRQSVNSRIDKLEAAVKALGNQQSDQTQKLIQNLLAAAKTSDPETAIKATRAATSLVTGLKQEKVPASDEFFQSVNTNIDKLRTPADFTELNDATFKAQQQLAEYRSALQSAEQIGSHFDCDGGPFIRIKPADPKRIHFVNLTVTDCSLTLDDSSWSNVVFINSRLAYKGGPLVLKDVIFVNCTFQPERNDGGLKLLEYAALKKSDLEVKPHSLKPS
jgi:hypothetical protein